MTEQNYYVDSPWGWRERLRWWLFPSRSCPLPTSVPPDFKDVLVIKTIAVFDWKDRLRLLLTGKLMIETRTVTEHTVGGAQTASVAYPILTLPAQEFRIGSYRVWGE